TDQHSTADRAPTRVGITRTVPPGRSVAVRGYPAGQLPPARREVKAYTTRKMNPSSPAGMPSMQLLVTTVKAWFFMATTFGGGAGPGTGMISTSPKWNSATPMLDA